MYSSAFCGTQTAIFQEKEIWYWSQVGYFFVNHHVGHKLSVVKTMNLRAETLITKEENITAEKELLANTFRDCKYPTWAIEHHKKRKTNKNHLKRQRR